MHEDKVTRPIYQQIAIDIARRIVSSEFAVGAKIFGRSTLAGEYKVSPETIRRAIVLLQDMNVVSVYKGSGIMVESQEEAFKFVDRFKDIESVASLKADLLKFSNDKKEIDKQISIVLEKIINYSDRLRNISPYNPMEVEITQDSGLSGKTILEVKFWQNTGGTIIAIRRNKDIVLSPGPYAELGTGDIIVVVGDEGVLDRINKFMNIK